MRPFAFLLPLIFFLAGCDTMKPQDFQGTQPTFKVEEFFAGRTKAWGIFEDRFGNLRRDFTVELQGVREGDVLTLTEDFLYSDGETERRVWVIRKQDEHTYSGTAGDVVGTAEGQAYGKALNWRYTMDLKVGDGSWRVNFDDWMFMADRDTVINRARVSKFGVEIGEVTVFFRKN
jgi:hypothetical protein